jgi:hypothetical protein
MRLVVVSVGLAMCVGCLAERTYVSRVGGTTTEGAVAEVTGSVGRLAGIEDRFGTDLNDSLIVDRDDNELWASMVVEHPNGRVYLDIDVYNINNLEPNQPVTATVQTGDEYTGEQDLGDDPQVFVYACPEGLNGEDVGESGDAEEVVLTIDDNDRLTFDAVDDSPEQQLFLGGWITAH